MGGNKEASFFYQRYILWDTTSNFAIKRAGSPRPLKVPEMLGIVAFHWIHDFRRNFGTIYA